MTKTVKDFYEEFDFENMLIDSPEGIKEFLDREIEFLEKNIKSEKEILEVGCGYGRLLKVLANKSKLVTGIDFSKKLLEGGREKLKDFENVKILFMHADNMTFENDSFDYSLCMDATFGNMPNIELEVLKEMKRVTKKDGTMIISVFSDNAKEVQKKNYKRIGLQDIKDKGKAIITNEGFYSRRFSQQDLKEMFDKLDLSYKFIQQSTYNLIAIVKKK